MAAPFLTGNVTYVPLAAVVDVQTIINQMQTSALALSPAWTNPLAGKIVSPADSAGRQMTIQFNKISATNLEMVVTDGSGRTSTRRAQIAAGGSNVNCYIGQFHMILDWLNGATPEGLFSVMLDESPELQTSHNMWLVMNGSRTTGDVNDGAWRFGTAFVIRSGGVFAVLVSGLLAPIWNLLVNNASTGNMGRTQGGSNLWCPLIQMGDPSIANTVFIYGKYFACLMTRVNFNAVNAEVSVPIDQANSVIFRVTNMATWSGGSQSDVMAVRKT